MNDLKTLLSDIGDLGDAAASAANRFAQQAGELVDIAFTTVDSPIGDLVLAATPTGLVRIGFDDESGVLEELAEQISPRILEYPARLEQSRRELDEYFTGRRKSFDMPLDQRLIAGFRREVLIATAKIPYGGVSTYQEVARKAGRPKGARAAGQALGGNPIPVVIPCHRVLRTGGGMGGYAGGIDRKQYLLRLEGAML